MNKCVWRDCNMNATQPQTSTDGMLWSFLCNKHYKKYQTKIEELTPEKILSAFTHIDKIMEHKNDSIYRS